MGKGAIMNYIELAERIISIDPFGARDAEETTETIAEQIKTDPESVIEYLLNIIEELEA
jgi:hypothetical protein